MSGSFSLLAEFFTHPVFVGAMIILLAGGSLTGIFSYINYRTNSDACYLLSFFSGILTLAVLFAFLIWCP